MVLASLLQPNWKLCVHGKIRILLFSDYTFIYIIYNIHIWCLHTILAIMYTSELLRLVKTTRRTTIYKKNVSFFLLLVISALNVQKYATDVTILFFHMLYNINEYSFDQYLSLCVTCMCVCYVRHIISRLAWRNRTNEYFRNKNDHRLSGWQCRKVNQFINKAFTEERKKCKGNRIRCLFVCEISFVAFAGSHWYVLLFNLNFLVVWVFGYNTEHFSSWSSSSISTLHSSWQYASFLLLICLEHENKTLEENSCLVQLVFAN